MTQSPMPAGRMGRWLVTSCALRDGTNAMLSKLRIEESYSAKSVQETQLDASKNLELLEWRG
jgi:hypothetical protein